MAPKLDEVLAHQPQISWCRLVGAALGSLQGRRAASRRRLPHATIRLHAHRLGTCSSPLSSSCGGALPGHRRLRRVLGADGLFVRRGSHDRRRHRLACILLLGAHLIHLIVWQLDQRREAVLRVPHHSRLVRQPGGDGRERKLGVPPLRRRGCRDRQRSRRVVGPQDGGAAAIAPGLLLRRPDRRRRAAAALVACLLGSALGAEPIALRHDQQRRGEAVLMVRAVASGAVAQHDLVAVAGHVARAHGTEGIVLVVALHLDVAHVQHLLDRVDVSKLIRVGHGGLEEHVAEAVPPLAARASRTLDEAGEDHRRLELRRVPAEAELLAVRLGLHLVLPRAASEAHRVHAAVAGVDVGRRVQHQRVARNLGARGCLRQRRLHAARLPFLVLGERWRRIPFAQMRREQPHLVVGQAHLEIRAAAAATAARAEQLHAVPGLVVAPREARQRAVDPLATLLTQHAHAPPDQPCAVLDRRHRALGRPPLNRQPTLAHAPLARQPTLGRSSSLGRRPRRGRRTAAAASATRRAAARDSAGDKLAIRLRSRGGARAGFEALLAPVEIEVGLVRVTRARRGGGAPHDVAKAGGRERREVGQSRIHVAGRHARAPRPAPRRGTSACRAQVVVARLAGKRLAEVARANGRAAAVAGDAARGCDWLELVTRRARGHRLPRRVAPKLSRVGAQVWRRVGAVLRGLDVQDDTVVGQGLLHRAAVGEGESVRAVLV